LPVAFSFEEQILLNIAAPLTTVLVGGVLIAGLAGIITRHAQKRRADRQLREQLVAEVTTAAATLYMATQHFRRARDLHLVTNDQLALAKTDLDRQYLDSRVTGTVLESRLEAYYVSRRPRNLCHQVMDLLTVRYFQLVLPNKTPYEQNEGDKHTGLSVAELQQRDENDEPQALLGQYRRAMKELSRALLTERLQASA
jgi:hypothetical protein